MSPSGGSPDRLRVAVVGATGLVGRTIIEILEERQFPLAALDAVASADSEGTPIEFGSRLLRVRALETYDFSVVDLAFFALETGSSELHVPRAIAAGCCVIDNSRVYRMDPAVPLIVPEVNLSALAVTPAPRLIANPNCSSIPLAIVLRCLDDLAGLVRVDLATYQAVSGAGRKGIEILARESRNRLSGQDMTPDPLFAMVPIAFNVIPQIDDFESSGYTREEMKIVRELRKILDRPDLEVNPTAVRVPVFFGHAAAVHAELGRPLDPGLLREALAAIPAVRVHDHPGAGGYPTPQVDATRHDEVFVGRIRTDLTRPNDLNFWVVSDNVRKGAALNAVQIGECLLARWPVRHLGGQPAGAPGPPEL
jgi:aspartate-semialdehyde dehydrogenase